MKTVQVPLGDRSYSILIGSGALRQSARVTLERFRPTSVVLVSHPMLMALYGESVAAGFVEAGVAVRKLEVPAGEQHKNLRTVERLHRGLASHGLDRQGLIVALGGGVLGDITGFVAATYLRGVRFVQAPTTLLAQVDASVGGKTGVDLPEGKNLVGAFYQPLAVIADTDTLATLPLRELRSGLAEVVKYGMITDDQLYMRLERSSRDLLRRDCAALQDAVLQSCEIKAAVVSSDETEQGRRAILNFGHTIGHALEAVTRYRRFKHGEAISIGMVSACLIGEETGFTPPEVTSGAISLLKRFRLPVTFPADVDVEEVIAATLHDKKRVGDRVTYILADRIGHVTPIREVRPEAVRRALLRQRD